MVSLKPFRVIAAILFIRSGSEHYIRTHVARPCTIGTVSHPPRLRSCSTKSKGSRSRKWKEQLGSETGLAARAYQRFSRIFRYSIFIGGPVCTCMPIRPSSFRFGASSSIVMLMRRPLRICVAELPRTMRWAAFQSAVGTVASSSDVANDDNTIGGRPPTTCDI